jgi:hypothetical protein
MMTFASWMKCFLLIHKQAASSRLK